MTRSSAGIAAPPGHLERLRVTLVSETFPPEINGVAHTVAQLAHGLGERGHAVQIVRPRQRDDDRGEIADTSSVLVRGVPLPGYPGLQMGLPTGSMLARVWKQQRPDTIYVATEGPLGWSAVRTARRLGIPCISGYHTRFASYSRHYGAGLLRSPIECYLRALHRRTACTLVPTEELRSDLGDSSFGNLQVLGRGVDLNRFNPEQRSEGLRRSWGVREGDLAVLHVGRLAPEKNLPLAFRAADAMRATNPRTRFIVVGNGPQYKKLFRDQQDVVFSGSKTGKALAEHYASADVLLFPSETETFGNVVLEAMASGLAVVAYDYAAARATIESGVEGLLVPKGQEETFVSAALRLALDPGFAKWLGLKAREKVLEHGWPRVIDRFESLLYRTKNGGPWDDDVEC